MIAERLAASYTRSVVTLNLARVAVVKRLPVIASSRTTEMVRVTAEINTHRPSLRLCTLTLILLALFAGASGCSHGPDFKSKLQAAGGAAALQTECAAFVRLFEQ